MRRPTAASGHTNPIDEGKETSLAHEAFLEIEKKPFLYYNCWQLLKPQPMMSTKFGLPQTKIVPAVFVNPALRLGTSGLQPQHSRDQQSTPPFQRTDVAQLQQPREQQPNPPLHRQQMQQQQSPLEQRSHQQPLDLSPVRTLRPSQFLDQELSEPDRTDTFDPAEFVNLGDHGDDTDITDEGLAQFFDSSDRTLSTVGRGGSAVNTTTSSKDDAATAPGYESCPPNGHHGVIDGVGTSSSSHDDEANTVNTPAPDIGHPQNLMGVKRYKKLKGVELESQKVKQQLQSLLDFQKTAISEAIQAGVAAFSTQCQQLISVFAQLDGRFGNISNSLPANEQTTTPAIKPLMNDVDFSGMVLN